MWVNMEAQTLSCVIMSCSSFGELRLQHTLQNQRRHVAEPDHSITRDTREFSSSEPSRDEFTTKTRGFHRQTDNETAAETSGGAAGNENTWETALKPFSTSWRFSTSICFYYSRSCCCFSALQICSHPGEMNLENHVNSITPQSCWMMVPPVKHE